MLCLQHKCCTCKQHVHGTHRTCKRPANPHAKSCDRRVIFLDKLIPRALQRVQNHQKEGVILAHGDRSSKDRCIANSTGFNSRVVHHPDACMCTTVAHDLQARRVGEVTEHYRGMQVWRRTAHDLQTCRLDEVTENYRGMQMQRMICRDAAHDPRRLGLGHSHVSQVGLLLSYTNRCTRPKCYHFIIIFFCTAGVQRVCMKSKSCWSGGWLSCVPASARRCAH